MGIPCLRVIVWKPKPGRKEQEASEESGLSVNYVCGMVLPEAEHFYVYAEKAINNCAV
jgi:hypothetical protein